MLLGAVKPVKSGPPNERQQSPPKPWVSKIFFQGQDVVKIVARDVDLRGTKAEASNSKAAAGFGTDADISRGRREECVCDYTERDAVPSVKRHIKQSCTRSRRV